MERALRFAFQAEWNRGKELRARDNLKIAHKVFYKGVWREKGRYFPKKGVIFSYKNKKPLRP